MNGKKFHNHYCPYLDPYILQAKLCPFPKDKDAVKELKGNVYKSYMYDKNRAKLLKRFKARGGGSEDEWEAYFQENVERFKILAAKHRKDREEKKVKESEEKERDRVWPKTKVNPPSATWIDWGAGTTSATLQNPNKPPPAPPMSSDEDEDDYDCSDAGSDPEPNGLYDYM